MSGRKSPLYKAATFWLYTLARGKVKSLEDICNKRIINQRSMRGRPIECKYTSRDISTHRYTKVLVRRLNTGGLHYTYSMTLPKRKTGYRIPSNIMY